MIVYSRESRASDIAWAFEEVGYEVVEYEENVKTFYGNMVEAEQVYHKLEQRIRKERAEACFSWNYLSILSDACEQCGIPYLSWSYDSPVLHVFAGNMHNKCNFFYVFDRCFYEEMKGYGLRNLYYLPLGVNSKRLKEMTMTDHQLEQYRSDVSFVGNLYQDNLFDTWTPSLPGIIVEKVSDIFCRQFNNWKENVIYQELDKGFLEELGNYVDMQELKEQFPYISERIVYGGLVLSRKYAQVERTCILEELAHHYPVVLYTDSDTTELPHVERRNSVDYRTQMPIAFCASRINLNITLKSIESGIPLRVFDIMGCGGFALTNRQVELAEYFDEGRELVVYDTVEELIDKVGYYLRHEKERVAIVQNGFRRVHADHNYVNRIKDMMRQAGVE